MKNHNRGLNISREQDAFVLPSGYRIRSVYDLLDKIMIMRHADFYDFVERDDFSIWIEHSLRNSELAELVSGVDDKEEFRKIVLDYLAEREHESSEKVLEKKVNDVSEKEDFFEDESKLSSSKKEVVEPINDSQEKTQEVVKDQENSIRNEDIEPDVINSEEVEDNDVVDDVEYVDKNKDFFNGVKEDDVEVVKLKNKLEDFEEGKQVADDFKGKIDNSKLNMETKNKSIYQREERNHDNILSKDEIQRTGELMKNFKKEINKVFIGQPDTIEKVSLTLMCNAHVLLEGVPGLAKTLLVETLTKTIYDTSFKRIQFLPDLLPSDILGGQMFNPQTGEFQTIRGPIFANFVLADEINRAPPKTHAALMECMQEKKVTIDKIDYPLDKPFFVIATQNPLENKGTYDLPEAVVDRFIFKVILDYPERKDELRILTDNATTKLDVFDSVKMALSKDDIFRIQEQVRSVYVSKEIREYIMDIIEATRGVNKKIEGARFIKYGGGPRASIYLTIAAKAQALFNGRDFVLPEDVKKIAPSVLRHRLSLNFVGKAHNISTDKIIEEILIKTTPI